MWSEVGVMGGVCVGDGKSGLAAAVVYVLELMIRVAGVAGIHKDVAMCVGVVVEEALLRQQY